MCIRPRALMTQSPMSGYMLQLGLWHRLLGIGHARMSMTGQSTRQVLSRLASIAINQ